MGGHEGSQRAFTASLNTIFEEAHQKGFSDFVFIRDNIIKLLVSGKCGAHHPVMLSVSHVSSAVIKLPPKPIPLNDNNYSRLKRTTSQNEFKGILLSMLTAMPQGSTREKRKQPRGNWMKGMKKNKPRPVQRIRESKNDNTTSYEPADSDEEVEDGNAKAINLALSAMNPDGMDTITDSITSILETRETAVDAEPTTEEVYKEDLMTCSPGRLLTPSSSVSSEQAVKVEDTMDVDNAEPVVSFDNLVTQIWSIGPSAWNEFKPELVDHLERLGLGQSAPPTVFDPYTEEGSPLKRLKAGLTAFADEISSIPPNDWREYEEGLTKLCADRSIMTMNYWQRHQKIVRLVFLKEETRAMKSGQWEGLHNIVRLCATLAELTGPPEDVQSQTDEWITSKFRDIGFLEQALKTKERISSAR